MALTISSMIFQAVALAVMLILLVVLGVIMHSMYANSIDYPNLEKEFNSQKAYWDYCTFMLQELNKPIELTLTPFVKEKTVSPQFVDILNAWIEIGSINAYSPEEIKAGILKFEVQREERKNNGNYL